MKRSPPPVQTHPYTEGEYGRCANCGYPRQNRRHQLKETPADVTEAERRRLGESE